MKSLRICGGFFGRYWKTSPAVADYSMKITIEKRFLVESSSVGKISGVIHLGLTIMALVLVLDFSTYSH